MHQWQSKIAASLGDIFGELDIDALSERRIRLATFNAGETGSVDDEPSAHFVQISDYRGNAPQARQARLNTDGCNLSIMQSQDNAAACANLHCPIEREQAGTTGDVDGPAHAELSPGRAQGRT